VGDYGGLSLSAQRLEGPQDIEVEVSGCRMEGFSGCIVGGANTEEEGDQNLDGLVGEAPWQDRRLYVHDNVLNVRRGNYGYTVYVRQDLSTEFRDNEHRGARRGAVKLATGHAEHKTRGRRHFSRFRSERFVDCAGAVALETDEYVLTTIEGVDFPSELGAAAYFYGPAIFRGNKIECPWAFSLVGPNGPPPGSELTIVDNVFVGVKCLMNSVQPQAGGWDSARVSFERNLFDYDPRALFWNGEPCREGFLTTGLHGPRLAIAHNTFRGDFRPWPIADVVSDPARFDIGPNDLVGAMLGANGAWGYPPTPSDRPYY
jgi:hypothetical protein